MAERNSEEVVISKGAGLGSEPPPGTPALPHSRACPPSGSLRVGSRRGSYTSGPPVPARAPGLRRRPLRVRACRLWNHRIHPRALSALMRTGASIAAAPARSRSSTLRTSCNSASSNPEDPQGSPQTQSHLPLLLSPCRARLKDGPQVVQCPAPTAETTAAVRDP